ncbi:MAG: DUF423 domain-containing protein [Polaribacter sp.]|nr:DUF423 domain-containing protein [Polaribacter sp.]
MFKNLIIASFFGMVAIILGAFGAHALKEILSIDELSSFETGVRYQMYHAIVLLFVNGYDQFTISQKNRITCLFVTGILLFSGSIYLIHFTSISVKSIWFLTPLGGLAFIIGWIFMILCFYKKHKNK